MFFWTIISNQVLPPTLSIYHASPHPIKIIISGSKSYHAPPQPGVPLGSLALGSSSWAHLCHHGVNLTEFMCDGEWWLSQPQPSKGETTLHISHRETFIQEKWLCKCRRIWGSGRQGCHQDISMKEAVWVEFRIWGHPAKLEPQQGHQKQETRRDAVTAGDVTHSRENKKKSSFSRHLAL